MMLKTLVLATLLGITFAPADKPPQEKQEEPEVQGKNYNSVKSNPAKLVIRDVGSTPADPEPHEDESGKDGQEAEADGKPVERPVAQSRRPTQR